MADRIVIMKDGHIQQVGTPDQVYHKPANTFVAQFIGAPSMNMLDAQLIGGRVNLPEGASLDMGLQRDPTDGSIVLGVRPDDLMPTDAAPLIEGRVSVREPLGAETLIYVETPGGEVVAKADGRNPPAVGEVVRLGADPANMHVFDRGTGAVLT